MKFYFIADLHINHARVLNFTNGEYLKWDKVGSKLIYGTNTFEEPKIPETIEAWNNTILENWNKVVTDEDVVFVLGDVICAKHEDVDWKWLHSYLCSLKGRIIFLRGNHDKSFFDHYIHNVKPYNSAVKLWTDTNPDYDHLAHINIGPAYAEIAYVHEGSFDAQKICLSHYPVYSWNGESFRSVLLYGHIHNNTAQCYAFEKITSEFSNTMSDNDKVKPAEAYNVGCMLPWMNFTPKTLDELRKIFS